MKSYFRTQANINLDAIYQNVENAKKLLKPDTGMMAVIKADGYGHGAVEIADTIDGLVDAYGVAILEEGIELRRAGVGKPILILGYTPPQQYEELIANDISAAVFTLEMARELSAAAGRMGREGKIHLKLDTGMSRIGFGLTEESLEQICEISRLPGIVIKGCFSHFATMDEADKTRAMEQFRRFVDFTEKIEGRGISLPVRHISNSAGIIEAPEVQMDMVRDGICLYGLYPSEEVQKHRLPLVPAMEWKARISFVKELPAGVEIGYGGTYTTHRDTKVATIPVGYADGYPRSLSERGSVLIDGKRAPILGRVCMDQFMVDVTEIPAAATGTEVTLVGRDGEEEISMEEISAMAHSFHYEFACDVGKRVPRVYFRHGKAVSTRDYYPVTTDEEITRFFHRKI